MKTEMPPETPQKAARTLEEVAPELGAAYSCWKIWEAEKNTQKDVFFALADAELRRLGLGLRGWSVTAPDIDIAKARAERHNPGWMVDTIRPHRVLAGQFDVVLGEDPTLMPFSFPHEGTKYARSVTRGAVMLDDEWLREDHPELYEQVTFELPWGERIAIPIEQLPKNVLGQIGPYLYNAKPKAKLEPPRQIKEDEAV